MMTLCVCINFECIVTVYTQFGYAQMDVDKYKDDFNPQNMNGASPEKKPAADDQQKEQQPVEGGGGIMQQTSSAASDGTNVIGGPLIVSNGDKIIELTYKWGKGYI